MKYEKNTRIRLNAEGARQLEMTLGEVGFVVDVDNSSMPVHAYFHCEETTYWLNPEWFEVIDQPTVEAPATASQFHKVVTLTGTGFVFTLDSEGNFTIRDVVDADGISLPFETVVAAVDELRKTA
jgi:hypothetical protein